MYTPPYPPRPAKPGSWFQLLWAARKNLIGFWPDFTFEMGSFSYKILGRSIHFLTTPDTVKQIFVDGGVAYERKTTQLRHALAPLIGDGLFISDDATWRTRRKIVASTTHVSRLPLLTPAITAGADALRADWLQRDGQEIDALATMADLTVGIIMRAACGRRLATAATRHVVSAFAVYRSSVGQTDILSFLGLLHRLPRVQGLRAYWAARKIKRVLAPLVDEIAEDRGAAETSLLRSMAQERKADGSPAMDRAALRNEAAVLILAGHEGNANTLAWAWFILSQDPDTERRLHDEVDAVLGDAPAVFADFEKLPFTRAVIEETMRLYPPIPMQGRMVARDGMIGGKHIKAGDIVVLNAWILHRHRHLWADPDAFVPDRFLPSGSGPPSRYAYVPFSIGPRVCSGAAFGLVESVLCLATLSRKVRLRLRPGWIVEPDCRLSLRPGKRLPMIIERRVPA